MGDDVDLGAMVGTLQATIGDVNGGFLPRGIVGKETACKRMRGKKSPFEYNQINKWAALPDR